MRTLLSSCCLISLALTGFGQTNGTRILQTVIEGGDTSQLPPQARAYLPWFREFLTFDPLAVMRRVRQPALILQGAPDRQVTADHAALLERAARESGIRDVTLRVLPGLNHLFLPARTGSWDEYSTLTTTTLNTDLLNSLGAGLEARLGPS